MRFTIVITDSKGRQSFHKGLPRSEAFHAFIYFTKEAMQENNDTKSVVMRETENGTIWSQYIKN